MSRGPAVPLYTLESFFGMRGVRRTTATSRIREASSVPLDPYQQYRATKVETAGSVDLVVMLYQGAVRIIRQSIAAMERDDARSAHADLVRAQDIIVELLASLNHEEGGQISAQLTSIYDYCFRRLVTANVTKDPAPAREVIGILRDLGTAWQQIAAQQRQAQSQGKAAAFGNAPISRAV